MYRTAFLSYICCFALMAHAAEERLKERLDSILSKSDRIEIYSTAEYVDANGRPAEKPPLCVLDGSGVASDFLSLWRVDESARAEPCMCDGDLYLDFFRSGKRLLRLQYYHGTYFRLRDGSLSGDAVIQAVDRKRVLDWLNAHGARSLRISVVEPEPDRH